MSVLVPGRSVCEVGAVVAMDADAARDKWGPLPSFRQPSSSGSAGLPLAWRESCGTHEGTYETTMVGKCSR